MHEFTRTPSSLLGALALAVLTRGCGLRGSEGRDTGDQDPSIGKDVRMARAVASGQASVPPRAAALALAESIEAQAMREGSGARAVSLHAVAARIVERVWRIDGRDRDASEALDIYRAASRAPDLPGACEAAVAGALLAGDAARDAAIAYQGLYRAKRTFGSLGEAPVLPWSDARRTCRRDIDDRLGRLDPFRPPQQVLDAIEIDVVGAGTRPVVAPPPESSPSKPPRITRIESWPGREAARVVVVLDRAATYRIDDEAAVGVEPGHTFVDLDGVDLGAAAPETRARGIVTRLRAASTTTGSRISIDLEGRVWRRAFVMRDPFRIVIDVTHHPPGGNARTERSLTRLVLDPGHGGRDNGAVGGGGLREKDVTLDIARRAAPILSANGIQVALTRDDDRFVPLEERTARANAFGADLFVSIHCNASDTRSRRGFEAYVLDTSRDEIAARVAARENATVQAGTAELSAILGDLRLADQSQRSRRFAELVERTAATAIEARYGDVVDGGVRTAAFYVLVGADMPGTLIETSYISNPVDEGRLSSNDYRQVLADAIANAVKAYREGR